MNNIQAAKVLMLYLPEIKDDVYKRATEIAIESILFEALEEWKNLYHADCINKSVLECLELTEEEYKYWLMGIR